MTLAQAHAVELRPTAGVAVLPRALLSASQSGFSAARRPETATRPVRELEIKWVYASSLIFKIVLGMPLSFKKASTERSLLCFLSGYFEHKTNKVCGNPGILA